MYDHALFLQTLTGFTQSLVMPHNTQNVLEQLTESVSAVLGITGSGVSLAVEDRLTLATAVPPRVAELEQFQERSQQGPGVEAYRSGKVVTVTDLSQGEQEWGDYTKVASRLGLAAVAAAPLVLGAVHLGALTLYAAEPRLWPSDDVAVVVALGTLATACLVNDSRLNKQEELVGQLQQALDSRVVVEQAKGMVAEAEGISVGEAFEAIRRYSRDHNAGLRSVAEDIVHRGLRP